METVEKCENPLFIGIFADLLQWKYEGFSSYFAVEKKWKVKRVKTCLIFPHAFHTPPFQQNVEKCVKLYISFKLFKSALLEECER